MKAHRSPILLALALAMTSSVAAADEPLTPADAALVASAERRQRPYQPDVPLFVTGAVVFGMTYASSVLFGLNSGLDADKRLFIPVAGPWIDLGQRPCAFGSECTMGDNVGSAALIVSGVLQSVGVLLAVASVAIPNHPAVRVYATAGGAGAAGTF